MANVSFLLPRDQNGGVISKFLDAFETVRMDMGGEPKYYGDLHPDGFFVIRQHTTVNGDEHITFYGGKPPATLAEAWENRATLEYVEYDALIV